VTLGSFGETWALGYLRRAGYRVIDRNVRFRVGELDIVAWDGDTLTFIEVKTRRSGRYGTPAESITASKYRHLAAAIEQYLQLRHLAAANYRLDLLALLVGRDGDVVSCELLRGIEPPE